MRFAIENKTGENIINIMRQAGYVFLGQQGNELNFAKQIGPSRFPRFHAFLSENKSEVSVNMHLDQKAPVYKEQKAHSGDYENNEALSAEAERIKTCFG